MKEVLKEAALGAVIMAFYICAIATIGALVYRYVAWIVQVTQ
jgi:hypothetical protein